MIRSLYGIAGLCCLTAALALAGCGNESKVTKTEKVQTPGGTTTTTTERKVESTGSNPPPNSHGESVPPK